MAVSIYLRHPFTMLIAGPTGSGKTVWVQRLLENPENCSDPAPTSITYCYGEYKPIFSTFKNTTFIHGLPDELMAKFDEVIPRWLVIDDLMLETASSKMISEIFTKGSHHRNLSIILIVQNLFMRGSESRNISLNSQYMVVFKNPRDQSIATNIARQMFPNKTQKFQQIYENATKKPFNYLFIDLKAHTHMNVRLLTSVLGEKDYMMSYLL